MAKKGGEARTLITLGCTECRDRTYSTSKNRRNDPNRIEMRKFCPRCRSHQLYREAREKWQKTQ